ncbi:MAG: phosphotransferase [Chloroflexota bacterium]|nr:MAG: hypothetical protein DLM70_11880 [Chloroflexota bacterium]
MTRCRPGGSSAAHIDDIRRALEGVLTAHFGTLPSLIDLVHRPSPYRAGFALEELEVRLDAGVTLRLLCKDLSREALLENVRRVKPSFLHDPLREIETYRTILDSSRLGTATCYGAVVDHERGRYWLFIENVAGCTLYQIGGPAWHDAARWLARMHCHFAGQPNLTDQARAAHLLRHDGDYYRLWLRRAQDFSRIRGNSRRFIEGLTTRYDRVVERLVTLPPTLIHGEFFASNVLVQQSSEGGRVCPSTGKWRRLGRASSTSLPSRPAGQNAVAWRWLSATLPK